MTKRNNRTPDAKHVYEWTPEALRAEWLDNINENPAYSLRAIEAAAPHLGLTLGKTLGARPVGACPKCGAKASGVDKGRDVSALRIDADELRCDCCGGKWKGGQLFALYIEPEATDKVLRTAFSMTAVRPHLLDFVAVMDGRHIFIERTLTRALEVAEASPGAEVHLQRLQAPDLKRAATILKSSKRWKAVTLDLDGFPVDLDWSGEPRDKCEERAAHRRTIAARERLIAKGEDATSALRQALGALQGGSTPEARHLDTVRAFLDLF